MNSSPQTLHRRKLRALAIATIATAGVAGFAVHGATPSEPTPSAVGAHAWHHHGPGARLMHILKQLNLSAEQQTQIKSIFGAAKPQFQELRASMRANRDALLAAAPTDPGYPALLATEKANAVKRIEQMSAVQTQIYAVLTPAQVKQIPQIIAADKAQWQQRHQPPAPAASTTAAPTSS